jgi:hypothetical protein
MRRAFTLGLLLLALAGCGGDGDRFALDSKWRDANGAVVASDASSFWRGDDIVIALYRGAEHCG